MDTEGPGASDIAQQIQDLGAREYLGVIEHRGAVVGWGILKRYHPRPGYARAGETSVYIDRSHTGQGHGSALQTELISLARSLDYHHLVAKIWASNDGSIRMHQRFGYEIVGTQREIGFVDGVYRDVTILQLILD